jgi:hypothetical protein
MNVTQKRAKTQVQPFTRSIKKVCKHASFDIELLVETLIQVKEEGQYQGNSFLNDMVINRAIAEIATL